MISNRAASARLRVTAGFGLADCLAQLGSAPDKVFRQAGIDPQLFDDPRRSMRVRDFAAVLEHAARSTRCGDFGRRFASTYDIRRLGPIGYLFHHGPTLGAALSDYASYFNSLQSGTRVQLNVFGDCAAMSYRIEDAESYERAQDAEFSTAIVINTARRIAGARWFCHDVQFEHQAGEGMGGLSPDFLGAPVRFGAASNRFTFPAALLDLPNPTVDLLLTDALKLSLTAKPVPLDEPDFQTAVRDAVVAMLIAGQGCMLAVVAAELGVTTRTIQRRLLESGLSFQRLALEAKLKLACDWLETTAMSVTDIALALDFSETSAFSRAFRVGIGQSPRGFRAGRLGRDHDALHSKR
ncbi:AraC family transcriptional regulator [Acidisoma cellulosilytica]|uniref:AraC family transcriptional regulator n=1 Tax=Acidisoma cellulosilyticum TaxID=2802395 RepID=A0A963Z1P2_9PROT|nr:AraC family transcriptional regulator [Acidisoma cellulosilyticum]MCB8880208.1 AraC family transcriptional regulator [Acidisoma cellulosilyticum]